MGRLARGHLLGRDDAARTHLVRGGVDGLRAAARPVAPTVASPVAAVAARTSVPAALSWGPVFARRALLLLLSCGTLLLRPLTRLLLRLGTLLLLLPAAVAMAAALAAPAASAATAVAAVAAVAVLLRAVRRPLPDLGGRRALAGDFLNQLLEKSKCHSAFLQSVNAKGRWKRNFHGGSLQASPAARGRAARRRVPN